MLFLNSILIQLKNTTQPWDNFYYFEFIITRLKFTFIIALNLKHQTFWQTTTKAIHERRMMNTFKSRYCKVIKAQFMYE